MSHFCKTLQNFSHLLVSFLNFLNSDIDWNKIINQTNIINCSIEDERNLYEKIQSKLWINHEVSSQGLYSSKKYYKGLITILKRLWNKGERFEASVYIHDDPPKEISTLIAVREGLLVNALKCFPLINNLRIIHSLSEVRSNEKIFFVFGGLVSEKLPSLMIPRENLISTDEFQCFIHSSNLDEAKAAEEIKSLYAVENNILLLVGNEFSVDDVIYLPWKFLL